LKDESPRLRELRLASLATDPDAFGGTYDRDAARPATWWKRWCAKSDDGSEQRTFVLVDDEGQWLGLTLVRRDRDAPGARSSTACGWRRMPAVVAAHWR
jgi:hypothetical protein